MSRQPEGVLKDAARKIHKAAGLRVFWQIEGKGINGIHDTLADHVDQSGLVLIEWKTPTGVQSEQQKRRDAEARAAGQRTAICRSIDDYRRAVGLL